MHNAYRATGTTRVATVTAVDINRGVCKCLGDQGESYSSVRWLIPSGGNGGGANYYPVENTRVLLDVSSGFPIIQGSLPAESLEPIKRSNIAGQSKKEDDIADYSDSYSEYLVRGTHTGDQRIGDQIVTSEGNGLFGLLRSGTFIAKASSVCQLVLSRFGDMGRIVTRNFEHFTDMDSTYKASIRGHIFSIREIFRSPVKSRAEEPNLVRFEGDVAAAEAVGTGYAAYTADDFPDVTPDDIVEKTYSKDDAGVVTSTETMDIHGARKRHTVKGTEYTNENTDYLSGHLDVNGVVTIDYDKNGVRISANGQVTADVNSNGVLTIHSVSDTIINTDADHKTTVLGNATLDVTGDYLITSTNTVFTCSNMFQVTSPGISIG